MIIKYKNILLNCISKVSNWIPQKYLYIFIIMFWLVLLVTGNITYSRLLNFIIIISIILIYKTLHKYIYNIYIIINKYINISENILLNFYRYKNPIILILIEIELQVFKVLYNIKSQNILYKYIRVISHILYNISGLSGIKIVLYKIYKILSDWKSYNIFEILFKRLFGMILSILVFTNLITFIIMSLNMITNNYIIWIYIFLVIIPYIYIILGYNIYSIKEIEEVRLDSNLIWNILEKKNVDLILKLNLNSWVFIYVHPKVINQNIKICLGMVGVNEVLDYYNFLIYLILKTNYNSINNLLYKYLFTILKEPFMSDYIYIKNTILKKVVKTENDIKLLDYCEYQILLYQLKVYYILDIEHEFDIKNSLLVINMEESDFSYDYNFNEFKYIYDKKIKYIKLNKFFDIYNKENYNFYQEMYIFFYDILLKETSGYKYLQNLEKLELAKLYNTNFIEYYYNDYEYYNNDLNKKKDLEFQLENWKLEWSKNKSNWDMYLKYYKIFNKLNNLKKQFNN